MYCRPQSGGLGDKWVATEKGIAGMRGVVY